MCKGLQMSGKRMVFLFVFCLLLLLFFSLYACVIHDRKFESDSLGSGIYPDQNPMGQ